MTISQPFFQEADTTDQNAIIGRNMIKDIFNSRPGLISDDALKVTQRSVGANDSVDIAPGGLILPGTENGTQGYYHLNNDRTANVKMATGPDVTNPRIDTVIVRVRDQEYSGTDNDAIFEWVLGTPASSPDPPDLDALGIENYYKLADISVPKDDNVVTSSDITDLRASPHGNTQGRASAGGCIITCTSSTRPSQPRVGQSIWEIDTKRWLFNEGTHLSPSWVVYGESGINKWTNYAPNFPLVGSYTTYGRYLKHGTTCFGITGFRLLAGTGNVTTTITCKLPFAAKDPLVTALTYMGGGRAFDSTGFLQGVYWSCAADILPGATLLINFATVGSVPWNATVPFNWGSGSTLAAKLDHFNMIFCYETAS